MSAKQTREFSEMYSKEYQNAASERPKIHYSTDI